MRDSGTRRWTHPATILVATDLSDLDHLMPFRPGAGARDRSPAHSPARAFYRHGHQLRCRRHAVLRYRRRFGDLGTDAAALVRTRPPGAASAATRWCARARLPIKLQPPSVSFRRIACWSEHGAGASSASCSLALWQNKCCARSTSRSLPWDPRLISRWTGRTR